MVALLLDANPNLSGAQVREILRVTSQDWGPAGQDVDYGWGRLDAHAAVKRAGSFPGGTAPVVPGHVTFAGTLATGKAEHTFSVNDTTYPLSVTLIMPGWTGSNSPDFEKTETKMHRIIGASVTASLNSRCCPPSGVQETSQQVYNQRSKAFKGDTSLKRLSAVVSEKPVEVLAGVVMVVVGFTLPLMASSTSSWVGPLGSGLATIGGVLLSWSASAVDSRTQAAEVLKPQLETLGRHLATVSGQLSSAVRGVKTKGISAEEAMVLVSQSTGTIYGIVNDIQALIGSKLSSKDLIDTVGILEEISAVLSGLETPVSQDAKRGGEVLVPKSTVAELREKVSDTLRMIRSPYPVVEADCVVCPKCGSEYPFEGSGAGQASVHCTKCDYYLVAKKRSNGKVATAIPHVKSGVDIEF